MDTQLGINNTGIPSFEYYVNTQEEGCFSTNDSVLWANLYTCFKDGLKAKYFQMRGDGGGIININTKKPLLLCLVLLLVIMTLVRHCSVMLTILKMVFS